MKKNCYWFLPLFCLSRVIAFVFLLGLILEGSAFGQGSLTPPGPPGPTMKTLQQIEPRAPLNALPGDDSAMFLVTQPGSYYLTTNIVVGPGTNAMRIFASDVVIDLNGFTIYGTTSRSAIETFGPSLARVRIHNGSLVGWGGGIDFVSNGVVTNGTFEDLVLVFSNLNSSVYGIGCGAERARVSRCTVTGLSGSFALPMYLGDQAVVEDCAVVNCDGGIVTGSSCVVKDCRVRSCPGAAGIRTGASSFIQHNLVVACKTGITFGDSCVVTDNSCQNAPAPSGAGFSINGSFNRIENNEAIGNAGNGFTSQSSATNNLVIRNFARGNGFGNYSLNSTDSPGPIVSSSGTITNNNPWANFSF